jgi:hypothetical protein
MKAILASAFVFVVGVYSCSKEEVSINNRVKGTWKLYSSCCGTNYPAVSGNVFIKFEKSGKYYFIQRSVNVESGYYTITKEAITTTEEQDIINFHPSTGVAHSSILTLRNDSLILGIFVFNINSYSLIYKRQ